MEFSKKESKSSFYHITGLKRYGIGLFIFLILIYLSSTIISIYLSKNIHEWYHHEFWIISIIGPIFFIFLCKLFFFSCTFHPNYFTFAKWPFRQKKIPWPKVDSFHFKQGNQNLLTILSGKNSYIIPIIDLSPDEFKNLILDKTKIKDPCIVLETKSKESIYIPENTHYIFGRQSFQTKSLKQDLSISSQQCKIFRDKGFLNIEIFPQAKNPILINNKEVDSQQILRLKENVTFSIGRHDFKILSFNLLNHAHFYTEKQTIIQFLTEKFIFIFKTLFITSLIFGIQTTYYIIKKENPIFECTDTNKSGCFFHGVNDYKMNKITQAIANFKKGNQDDAQINTYLGVIFFNEKNLQQADKYLTKSCQQLNDYSCLLLSINSSKDKYVSQSTQNLQQECINERSSKACKYLANYFSLKNNLTKSLEFLALTLSANYLDYLWIMVDPQLENLRHSEIFINFWGQWINRLELKKQKASSVFDSPEISSYLKLKLFLPVHPRKMMDNCPNIRCFPLISDKIYLYYQLINPAEIYASIKLMQEVFSFDQTKQNQILESKLDQLEYYIDLYKILSSKKISNTIGFLNDLLWLIGFYTTKRSEISQIIKDIIFTLDSELVQSKRFYKLKALWSQENISLAQLVINKTNILWYKFYSKFIKNKLPVEMQNFFYRN